MKKNIYLLIILYQGMIYTKDSHDHISSNVHNDVDIDEDINSKESEIYKKKNKIITKNNSRSQYIIIIISTLSMLLLIFVYKYYNKNIKFNVTVENIINEFDKLMQEVGDLNKKINTKELISLKNLQKQLLNVAYLECNFIQSFINNIEEIPLNVLETLIVKMTEYLKKKQIYNNIIIKDCVEDPDVAQRYLKQHFYFTTEAKIGITTESHLANYFVRAAVSKKLAKIYNELFNDIKKSNSPLNFNFNTLNSWINKYSKEDDQQYKNFNLLISCYFLSDIPWGIFLYKYLSKITKLEHEKITEELKYQEIIKNSKERLSSLSNIKDMINIMAKNSEFDVLDVGCTTFYSTNFFYHMTIDYLNVILHLSKNEDNN